MAVYNTGPVPHKQHFYGLSTDNKPDGAYPGDRFYEFDTGKHFIWNGTTWVEYFSLALYENADAIAAHKAETMPHQFIDEDADITYKYGLSQKNGFVVFNYQEVE